MDKAHADLAVAELVLARDAPFLHQACFHAQQAAEKYLKAYLSARQVEFPKTHVIRELLNLVAQVDSALPSLLASAAVLTPYGTEVRYPRDIPDPTLEEAQQALSLARQVRDAVLAALPADLRREP